MNLSLGVIMDPIQSIKPVKDSTFAMMLEAQRRGYEIWYMEPGDLVVDGGNTHYKDDVRRARELAQQENLVFIHPFDDPEVIAGQGTIGMEILRQHPGPPYAIFVPVGGGGLIAGIAAYVKYVFPQVRVIGVEPEDAPTLYRALEAGRRVSLKQVGIFADGVAVRQIGKETFRIARQVVESRPPL